MEPQECLFVDDRADNVEGARAVGMVAFVHVGSTATVAAIRDAINRPTATGRSQAQPARARA